MIKNIIFDLGNVLVQVDFAKSEKLLLNAGVRKNSFDKFFSKIIFYFRKINYSYLKASAGSSRDALKEG